MADVEVQLTSNSASAQHEVLQEEDMTKEESLCTASPQNAGQGEESLSLLADVALAPPCGGHVTCSSDCEACSCLELRHMEESLQSLQLQLQFLMSKADDLHDCLVNEQDHLESEALAAAVPSFLYTCQPFFNHLEAATRNFISQYTPLPLDIYMRLLDLSQQLCDRLEQLVLTYASYSLLCLDETEPNNLSHFCIGQTQLGRLRLTVFLYCKPTPYLARVDTGLHKRMRWNVERVRDDEQQQQQQTDEEQGRGSGEGEADTEYYFLCCEDILNTDAEAVEDSQGVSDCDMMRMWSIGQWVQVNPDPSTEDIDDWITCEVPQATYHRLLFLGSNEPSACSATDYLLQQLLSHCTTD
ncbi:UPF0575 protein C19orf67 homolog [Pempheris klunzingeri]|uniref:UPF0575 protein C19orf67 homolog n=1 Tax=Pempheris klunzingeri TaxID=3127111 RepID=UPI00397F3543